MFLDWNGQHKSFFTKKKELLVALKKVTSSKLTNMKKGLAQHEASPFFDNLVFSKVTIFQCKIIYLVIEFWCEISYNTKKSPSITDQTRFRRESKNLDIWCCTIAETRGGIHEGHKWQHIRTRIWYNYF